MGIVKSQGDFERHASHEDARTLCTRRVTRRGINTEWFLFQIPTPAGNLASGNWIRIKTFLQQSLSVCP